MNEMLCTNCGEQAIPKTYVKGSGAIDILLWVIFLVVLLWFGIIGLLFLIVSLVHSIWRSGSRYKACPKCKTPNMIELDSPAAQQLLKKQEKEI